jgi:hypothetical protein
MMVVRPRFLRRPSRPPVLAAPFQAPGAHQPGDPPLPAAGAFAAQGLVDRAVTGPAPLHDPTLNSGVNDRRRRGCFRCMVSMMNILPSGA